MEVGLILKLYLGEYDGPVYQMPTRIRIFKIIYLGVYDGPVYQMHTRIRIFLIISRGVRWACLPDAYQNKDIAAIMTNPDPTVVGQHQQIYLFILYLCKQT